MSEIRIKNIQHGWFEMTFGSESVDCSDWTGHDTQKELLNAVADVIETPDCVRWVLWPDEPGASIMCIKMEIDNTIGITLYLTGTETDEIENKRIELKTICEELCWSCSFPAKEIIDDLVMEFSLYENGNGRVLYEKNWYTTFPDEAFCRLKSIAFRMRKTNGSMLCAAYLSEK